MHKFLHFLLENLDNCL